MLSADLGAATAPALNRRTELRLLLFALLLAAGAQLAVTLSHDDGFSGAGLGRVAELAVLVFAAHIAIRRFAPNADPLILPIVATLNGLGLAVIGRLDQSIADNARVNGNHIPSGDAPLQLVWTAIGIGGFIAVLMIVRDHRMLAKYGYTAA